MAAPRSEHSERVTGRLTRILGPIALGILFLSIGALMLALKTSAGEVTVGDEARFGAEAHEAVSVERSSTASGFTFSMRTVGVHTTSDFYGGAATDQPGPMAHLIALPFVKLLGVDVGLWTMALLVNLSAILLSGWVAARSSGRAVAACVMVGGFVTASLTTGTLTSALNVHLVVLPSFAVFVVAWGLARGDLVMLPVLAGVTSFVVQTHIGYGVTPVLVALTATVASVVSHHGRHSLLTEPAWRWTVGVIGALWLLPVLDQLGGTGNLGELLSLRLPGAGIRGAWLGLGAVFHLPPLVMPSHEELQTPQPLVVGLGAVALLVGRRRGWMVGHRQLALIAAVVVAGAVVTAAMSPPTGTATYHLHWIGLTSGFLITALGMVSVPRLALLRSNPARGSVAALVAIAVAAMPLAATQSPPPTARHVIDAAGSLTDQLDRQLSRNTQWNISARGGFAAEEVANSVAIHLTESGLPIRKGTGVLPGESTLVVVSGDIDPNTPAERIASFGVTSPQSRQLSTRIDQFARAHAPVRLSTLVGDTVLTYLDGRTGEICPTDDELGREAIDALAPGTLAGLYGHGMVSEPDLPAELADELWKWMIGQPISVYELRTPTAPDEVYFSDISCGDG